MQCEGVRRGWPEVNSRCDAKSLAQMNQRDDAMVIQKRPLHLVQSFGLCGIDPADAVPNSQFHRQARKLVSGVRGFERPLDQSKIRIAVGCGLNRDACIARVQSDAFGHRSEKQIIGRIAEADRPRVKSERLLPGTHRIRHRLKQERVAREPLGSKPKAPSPLCCASTFTMGARSSASASACKQRRVRIGRRDGEQSARRDDQAIRSSGSIRRAGPTGISNRSARARPEPNSISTESRNGRAFQ